jgi:hypothetical protein
MFSWANLFLVVDTPTFIAIFFRRQSYVSATAGSTSTVSTSLLMITALEVGRKL